MKLYVCSLAAGVLVGVIYGLLQVRSPAPPVIALLGLAGILIGEQAVPLVKHGLAGSDPVDLGMVTEHLRAHSFGELPTQPRKVSRGAP